MTIFRIAWRLACHVCGLVMFIGVLVLATVLPEDKPGAVTRR